MLPDYVRHRRWFGAKDETIETIELARVTEMPKANDLLLAEIRVTTSGSEALYTLPLGIAWEGEQHGPFASNLAIARVRRERYVGLLTDGFALREFARSVSRAMRDNARVPTEGGELVFEALEPDRSRRRRRARMDRRRTVEQHDGAGPAGRAETAAQAGAAASIPMSRWCAIWRSGGFETVPPILGTVKRVGPGRGDAADDGAGLRLQSGRWLAVDAGRAGEAVRPTPTGASPITRNFAENLGRRLAEMHDVLARPSDDPAFAPEPMDQAATRELSRPGHGRIRQGAGPAARCRSGGTRRRRMPRS